MTPRVLLLGGVDPSGGAGLAADLAVVTGHGGLAMPVPVVLTAQNRSGCRAVFPCPREQVLAMVAAVLDDGPVHAVKVGLLGTPEVLATVVQGLLPLVGRAPIVVDPVLGASAGGFQASAALREAYLARLVPLADLVTPNLPELDALAAGEPARLLDRGCRAVLQKGGHGPGAAAEDRLYTTAGVQVFARPRLLVGNVRGTGCSLASAIAVGLALGQPLGAACGAAGDWLHARLAELGPAAAGSAPRCLRWAATAADDA